MIPDPTPSLQVVYLPPAVPPRCVHVLRVCEWSCPTVLPVCMLMWDLLWDVWVFRRLWGGFGWLVGEMAQPCTIPKVPPQVTFQLLGVSC